MTTIDYIDASVRRIFSDILGMAENRIGDASAYGSCENWDSIRHMQIVAALEEEFGVEFLFEDISAMKTFRDVREIVARYANKDGK